LISLRPPSQSDNEPQPINVELKQHTRHKRRHNTKVLSTFNSVIEELFAGIGKSPVT